jgi:HTH-type transcriptional regulator/antitoxin HipB
MKKVKQTKKEMLQTVSLEKMLDKHIGQKGSLERNIFENELRMDLLGKSIREVRKAKNLTQTELGQLVGVQKAQISKIENSVKSARLETIMNVFDALGVLVSFKVEVV